MRRDGTGLVVVEGWGAWDTKSPHECRRAQRSRKRANATTMSSTCARNGFAHICCPRGCPAWQASMAVEPMICKAQRLPATAGVGPAPQGQRVPDQHLLAV